MPGKAITEIYYDIHLNPVIIKEYEVKEELNQIISIQLNQRGMLLKRFENEKAFLAYWFKEIIEKYEIEIALVDRVLEFYGPLREVKEAWVEWHRLVSEKEKAWLRVTRCEEKAEWWKQLAGGCC